MKSNFVSLATLFSIVIVNITTPALALPDCSKIQFTNSFFDPLIKDANNLAAKGDILPAIQKLEPILTDAAQNKVLNWKKLYQSEIKKRQNKQVQEYRKNLKIGDDSNIGMVLDIKSNQVKINDYSNKTEWVPLANLYPSRFLSDKYLSFSLKENWFGNQQLSTERLKALNSMEFKLIPAGTFVIGSSNPEYPSCRDSHELRHVVILTKPFCMQTTEVTQAQWQAVTGYSKGNPKGDMLPVGDVSWGLIQKDFLAPLNNQGKGQYRLPTEAEWEYAATSGGENNPWDCKNSEDCKLENFAWFTPTLGGILRSPSEYPHPVAQKRPNAWGLYDMLSNVSEWVQDRYANFGSVAVTNPVGPATGNPVYRGGSTLNQNEISFHCRRHGHGAWTSLSSVGFRLVRKP